MSSEPVYKKDKQRKILYSVEDYAKYLLEKSMDKSTSSSKNTESNENIGLSKPQKTESEPERKNHIYAKATSVLTPEVKPFYESLEDLKAAVANLRDVVPGEVNMDEILSLKTPLDAIEKPKYAVTNATKVYGGISGLYATVTKASKTSQQKANAIKAIANVEAASENVALQALITHVSETLQANLCALLYIFINVMYNYENNSANYLNVTYVSDVYDEIKKHKLTAANVTDVEHTLISILIPQELMHVDIDFTKKHVINIINVLIALGSDTYKTKINSEILPKKQQLTAVEMNNCKQLTGITIKIQNKTSKTTKDNITTLARECLTTLLGLLDNINEVMKLHVFAADIIGVIKCDFKMITHNILKNLKDNPDSEVNGIINKFTEIPGDTKETKLKYLMSDDFILYLKQVFYTEIDKFTNILLNIYELTLYCECNIFTYKKFRSYESTSCIKEKNITITEQTRSVACDNIRQKITKVQLVVINFLYIDNKDKVNQVTDKYIKYLDDKTRTFTPENYNAELIYESITRTINGSVSISSAASTIKDELNSLPRTAETNRFKAFIKGVWRWIKSFIKNKPPEIIASQELSSTYDVTSIANPMYGAIPQKEKSLTEDTFRSRGPPKSIFTNPVYESIRKKKTSVSVNPLFKQKSNVPIAYNNPLYDEVTKTPDTGKVSSTRVTENPLYSTVIRKKQPSGFSNPLYKEPYLPSTAKRANDTQLKSEIYKVSNKQDKGSSLIHHNSRENKPAVRPFVKPSAHTPSAGVPSHISTSFRSSTRLASARITPSAESKEEEFECPFTKSENENVEERQILNNVFAKLDDTTLKIGKHSNSTEMKGKRKECLKTALLKPKLNRNNISKLEKGFMILKSNAKDSIKEKIQAITNNNTSKKANNMPNANSHAKTKKLKAKFKLVGLLSMF